MSWLTTAANKYIKHKTATDSLMIKLITNNTGYSVKSFFLLVITGLCFMLLLLPAIAIVIDLIYNHTVTMSWSDMGMYIGAVFSGATGAGLVKAWSEKYERYPGPDGILGTEDDIIVKRSIFSAPKETPQESYTDQSYSDQ